MVKKEGFSNLGVLEEINFAPPSKSSSKTTSLPQSQSSTAPVQAKATPPSKPKIAQVTPSASAVSPQASQNSVSKPQISEPPVAQNLTPKPPPPIGAENSPYAFHAFRLSYMQSDRVLALLKSVGYSTIEFSSTRGESLNENIYSALNYVPRYPLIVKMLDSSKTSLMQPALDGGRNMTEWIDLEEPTSILQQRVHRNKDC